MDTPATPATPAASNPNQQLSALAAAFAGLLEPIRSAAKEQEAALRLLAVVRPGYLPVALLEVTRRTELFSQQWVQGPYQHDITPRTAALLSVTYDLANGWFL